MFEKVNPSHPDKIADRIAGAIVDLAYAKCDNPHVAVEVLVGHGQCVITGESNLDFDYFAVEDIVQRITNSAVQNMTLNIHKQDTRLARNQWGKPRCGDNGIFKGCFQTPEQAALSTIARNIYSRWPTDGKYLIDTQKSEKKLVICQSHAKYDDIRVLYPKAVINPLGEWSGGLDVDTGASNRKLGSDMGDAITGGGLHGKDLSKADITLNIYARLKAIKEKRIIELSCAIGDETVDGIPYSDLTEMAKIYINTFGGFEKFAEWGFI